MMRMTSLRFYETSSRDFFELFDFKNLKCNTDLETTILFNSLTSVQIQCTDPEVRNLI